MGTKLLSIQKNCKYLGKGNIILRKDIKINYKLNPSMNSASSKPVNNIKARSPNSQSSANC